jgi:hypothetical protein
MFFFIGLEVNEKTGQIETTPMENTLYCTLIARSNRSFYVKKKIIIFLNENLLE